MGRTAEKIYTTPRAITHIKEVVLQLPTHARVLVTMRDGEITKGTVIESPVIQLFQEPSGREGLNAIVRIEDSGSVKRATCLWIGDIAKVERLAEMAADEDRTESKSNLS